MPNSEPNIPKVNPAPTLTSRPRGITHWPLVISESHAILGHMPKEYLNSLRPTDQIYTLVPGPHTDSAPAFWHINWTRDFTGKQSPTYFILKATTDGQVLTDPAGSATPMEAEPANSEHELEILTHWAGIGMRIWGTVQRRALLTCMKTLMLQ